MATPEAFARDLAMLHGFYNPRRHALRTAESNTAHFASRKLQRHSKGALTLLTQNVDDLNQSAGTGAALPIHGLQASLGRAGCAVGGRQVRNLR